MVALRASFHISGQILLILFLKTNYLNIIFYVST